MTKIKHLILRDVSIKGLEGADVKVTISFSSQCDESEAQRILSELLPYVKTEVNIGVESTQVEMFERKGAA